MREVEVPVGPDTNLVRVRPKVGERAMLVVHRRKPCSGSAAMVFLDASRTFYGAVAPGEAAFLLIPENTKTLYVMPSVEIVAQPRMWFYEADRLDLAPEPSGVLVDAWPPSGRHCTRTGAYADARLATKEELESALREAPDIHWTEPDLATGQLWLDANKTRVGEVLAASIR